MRDKQIINVSLWTNEQLLFSVFNNVNQIFKINERQFQEITKNLGIRLETEELGGGTKYKMGYVRLGNEQYSTDDYLTLWNDVIHEEHYIYIYRDSEELVNLASIDFTNIEDGLWHSFDMLMKYNNTMECWSCNETRPTETPNRVPRTNVVDDTEYCDECKLTTIKTMSKHISKYSRDEIKMYENYLLYFYNNHKMPQLDLDGLLKQARRALYNDYWNGLRKNIENPDFSLDRAHHSQNEIWIKCDHYSKDSSTQEENKFLVTILFEDNLGDDFKIWCPFDGKEINPKDVYNVFSNIEVNNEKIHYREPLCDDCRAFGECKKHQ